MNILITGGAGVLGSKLSERFIDKGETVTIVDNMHYGKIEFPMEADFVKLDISEKNKRLEKLIKQSDIVYHLAAISQVMECERNPKLCFKYNVLGTLNISEICAKTGTKLIFTSSREVYGNADYLPVDENHPLKPKNMYAYSKVLSEAIIRSYNTDYVIIRLSNVIAFGDERRVVNIFIKNALENKPIILFGGKQILDFIYINDVIDVLIKSEKISNEIVNVGSGDGLTIKELAETIKKKTESDSKIIYKPKRKEEIESYISDISKIKKLLAWKPKNNINKTLELIISKYKMLYNEHF